MGQNPGTLRRTLPVETFAYRSLEPGHCVRQSAGAGRRFGRIKKNSRSCQAQGLSLLSGGPRGISLSCGPTAEAGKHFEKAMKLARSRSEMNFFDRKLKACR